MSWWERRANTIVGDGPLDIAEDFLQQIAIEYKDELGRKPHLSEVLSCLQAILETRSDEFCDDCDELVVSDITARAKKRPKKQLMAPGDIFTFKHNGKFYYGRVTPQLDYYEFYKRAADQPLSIRDIISTKTIEFPFMVSNEAILNWEWRIVGKSQDAFPDFQPRLFLIGQMVADTFNRDPNGFIDISANLRKASASELQSLPKFNVCPAKLLPVRLEKILNPDYA